jgi:hypothetical protein
MWIFMATGYNAHYEPDDFYIILAVDSVTSVLLAVKPWPGNICTSRETDEFLRPIASEDNTDFSVVATQYFELDYPSNNLGEVLSGRHSVYLKWRPASLSR